MSTNDPEEPKKVKLVQQAEEGAWNASTGSGDVCCGGDGGGGGGNDDCCGSGEGSGNNRSCCGG